MREFIKYLLTNYVLNFIFIVLFFESSLLAAENYELVAEWEASGTCLAIDSENNIYVSGSNRISKYTSEGDLITKWGNHGSGNGEFIGTWGIDVDSEGNVYVADMINDRIQKFTSDGVFITKWSMQVEGIWTYSMPQGVAVDTAGFVYVQHTSVTPPALLYSCIQKFTTEGVFIKKWYYLWGLAFEMTTDSENNVYAAGAFFGPLQKFNADGKLVDEWNTCSLSEGFCTSTGIALDSEGNVYVSDMMHHSIKKFTSDGNLIAHWTLQGSGGFGTSPAPYGLAVDSEGYVYVIDLSNALIQKYVKSSSTTTTICPLESIYGNDSEKMKLLRHFRDNLLGKTPEGKEIIRLYYEWSPSIVKAMEGDDEFTNEVKEIIDKILPVDKIILS